MSTPRSRQFVTFLLVLGAVAFGMVLAGGLEVTPSAVSGPATPAAQSNPSVPPMAGVPNFADLAEAVDPAVVSIQAISIEESSPRGGRGVNPFEFFFGPRQRRPEPEGEPEPFRSDAGGSGFVVSGDGLVVTNYHVIREADQVRVRLGERDYEADVKGSDPATDIALLKIDAGSDLTFLRLGDSESLRVGEWVMAIGSPLNLTHSVTVGVVSAKGRALGIADASFENFIQTDAAINFGNSGGPLINMRGEVVGINTAINYGAENIGFAVPVNTLKQILPQLREEGRVRRGYLGIEVRNLDYDAAEAYGLDEPEGALVARVIPGNPAARAGLQPEDIILKVDDQPVKTTRDLIDYVSAQGPDASVTLEVLREGKVRQIEVELAERDVAGAEAESPEREDSGGIDWLGLRYQDLSSNLRANHGIPDDVNGVWVTHVAPTSPLYESIGRTDNVINVITSVNGREVGGVDEFEEVVRAAPSGSRLRLYVQRFFRGEEVQPVLAFPSVP